MIILQNSLVFKTLNDHTTLHKCTKLTTALNRATSSQVYMVCVSCQPQICDYLPLSTWKCHILDIPHK